jgi:hypothetical protein
VKVGREMVVEWARGGSSSLAAAAVDRRGACAACSAMLMRTAGERPGCTYRHNDAALPGAPLRLSSVRDGPPDRIEDASRGMQRDRQRMRKSTVPLRGGIGQRATTWLDAFESVRPPSSGLLRDPLCPKEAGEALDALAKRLTDDDPAVRPSFVAGAHDPLG